MADNITLNSGTGGATLAADDVSSVWYQQIKLVDGTADATTVIAAGGGVEANALRVTIANDSTGVVSVDDNGANLSVDWAGTVPPIGAGTEAAALRVTLATDSTGVVSIDDGGGDLSVDWAGTAPPIGAGTEAAALRVTVATDSTGVLTVDNAGTFATQVDGDALTALQLIDDIVFTDDTSTHATGTTKGAGVMAAATPTDGSVAANDIGMLAMSLDRRLHTDTQIVGQDADINIADGGNNISVDWGGTVPPIGAVTEAAALRVTLATDSTGVVSIDDGGGDLSVDWAGTAPPIGAGTEAAALRVTVATDSTGVLTVDNAGTFATQVDGDALTALQLIDDIVFTDDTSTHATGTTKGAGIMAAATPTDGSVAANDIGMLAMSLDRRLHVDGDIVTQTLAALTVTDDGSFTLAANSGVDIGDVDVLSIAAGSNLIGDVGLGVRTSGGLSRFKSIDLDETEEAVKASAGQVYAISAFNTTAAPLFLKLYDATVATVVVGTTVPDETYVIPANADNDGAGFTQNFPQGVAFATAITAACTTGVADNDAGAPGANDCVVMIHYA